MKKFISVKYAMCFIGLTHIACTLSMNTLLPETIQTIFYNCDEHYTNKENEKIAIVKTLKTILALDLTCTHFHQILDHKTIGIFFTKYTNELQTILLTDITIAKERERVLGTMNPIYYQSKRRFACGLMCAGAKLENSILTCAAMNYNDMPLVQFLCNTKKIDLCELDWSKTPVFYRMRTQEMAELCKNNGIDLNANNINSKAFCCYPNILWNAATDQTMSSDMMRYYLENGVAIISRESNQESLLHHMALISRYISTKNAKNFLEKVELLLEKNRALVNAVDNKQRTPLDCAHQALNNMSYFDDTKTIKKLIKLLKRHGGKALKKHEDTCVLC